MKVDLRIMSGVERVFRHGGMGWFMKGSFYSPKAGNIKILYFILKKTKKTLS